MISRSLVVQLGLALLSLLSTGTYAAYFRWRARSPRSSGNPRRHLLPLLLLVDLPLERVWWVLPWLPQPRSHVPAPLLWFGVAWLVLGAYYYAAYLRWNMPATAADYAAPSQLVVNGVYARVRHPGAVGSFCVVAGLCVVSGASITTALLPLFAAVIHQVATLEERAVLSPQFGEAHRAYARQVPRYLERPLRGAALALIASCAWTVARWPRESGGEATGETSSIRDRQ